MNTSYHGNPRPNDRNISMQFIATLLAQHVAGVWPPCCDVLRHLECCWHNLKVVKFFMQLLWMLHDVVQSFGQVRTTMLHQGHAH